MRATNFFCMNIHNIHQDGSILCQALTCLMIEEIPAHFLRPRVLTRCQNPSSSAKCRHQPHLLRPLHLRQPRTRRLRTDGVKKRRSFLVQLWAETTRRSQHGVVFCSQILFLSATVALRTTFLSLADFKSNLSRTNLKLPSSATWP